MHRGGHICARARKRQNHGPAKAASAAGDNAGGAGKIGIRHFEVSLVELWTQANMQVAGLEDCLPN
jgi:hypothetical protein